MIANKVNALIKNIKERYRGPVSDPSIYNINNGYDWVNTVPVKPQARAYARLKPILSRMLFNVVWITIVVAVCYTGFRALDYRAIEEGCLRYEINPTQVSDKWESVCKS